MPKVNAPLELALSTGKSCKLLRIRNDLIPNYYLLAFPKGQGEPSSIEVTEMLSFGIEKAREIAFDVLGDSEAFSVLYSASL